MRDYDTELLPPAIEALIAQHCDGAMGVRELAARAYEMDRSAHGDAAWHETIERLCAEWDIEHDCVTAIFNQLIPYWSRDPTQSHAWIPLDDLIQSDDYGVPGSTFYRCRLCDGESGAGMLNRGIQHLTHCPLHDDNFGKLVNGDIPPISTDKWKAKGTIDPPPWPRPDDGVGAGEGR